MEDILVEGPLNEKNPLQLLEMMNKFAEVAIIKDLSYSGIVNTIDPLTGSITLIQAKEDKQMKILIPGHSIVSLRIKQAENEVPKPTIDASDCTDVTERKNKVLSWLTENLLPVNDSDGVLKCGTVEIHAPYTEFDIFTENLMVYSQVCDLIRNMPT